MSQKATDAKNFIVTYFTLIEGVEILQQKCYFNGTNFHENWYEQ